MPSIISNIRPPSTLAKREPLWFAAPGAAILYPFPLITFHSATGMIAAGSMMGWIIAALSLTVAILLPVLALLVAFRLSQIYRPSAAERLARRVAMLAVAAPPLFTFTGVIFILLGAPHLDIWFVTVMWLVLAAAIARADHSAPALVKLMPPHSKMRVAHGAAAILALVYIAFHFGNHLIGLAGHDAHTGVMKVLRQVYRSTWVEPILLAGFAFLIVSGARMSWRLTERGTDYYRTFQVTAGIYLIFAVISHLNAVLYLARMHFGIDTDWAFATGAPLGMLKDAWNIRLVPYYLLATFFVVAHAFSGLRMVMLAHGARRLSADIVMWCGSVFAALLAIVIILAMCGLRVNFV